VCALPYGLLSVILGILALVKGWGRKALAVLGILFGVLDLLLGALAWAWYFMIAAFVAAFS
jgi:hypothetical protein